MYKRSQGRIARQVTFAAIWLLVRRRCLAVGRYLQQNAGVERELAVAIPAALVVLGGWIAFRLVNLPSFADFLIAVEAEMNKVSWPTRSELIRSSLVVIFSILFLAVVLYCYDTFWVFLLSRVGRDASERRSRCGRRVCVPECSGKLSARSSARVPHGGDGVSEQVHDSQPDVRAIRVRSV